MAVWMLPEGVEELLPPAAWRLELLRRRLLDHYRAASYEFVLPPLIEHRDTLLAGAGSALLDQTFTLTDPASGRLLGLRADMTPQAARIAARHFGDREQVRLCYLGSVLRTRADAIGAPRGLIQVGCELFGDASLAGDIEILRLMLQTLDLAGVRGVHLDLGHVGISRAVVARLQLSADAEGELLNILQRKSAPDLATFAQSRALAADAITLLRQLMDLHGDAKVIDAAAAVFADAGAEIASALADLRAVVQGIAREFPALPLHIDLAELRGYRYHTGLVFAAYVEGAGREIARAGRYDGAGAEYGRPRPATGFSADLNELMRLGN
jgi:ATP phosphoribosyltransferase regulatory subunit